MDMDEVLLRAYEEVLLWEGCRDKASRLLSSLANLVEQLNTVQSCMSQPDKLGVLCQHSQALYCLQGKLVEAMERALVSVQAERCKMLEIVCLLKKCSREAETKLKHITGRCSVESVCCRTSQTFSPVEQCGWLRLIHAAYTADTEDKDLALEVVQYTVQGVEEAITVWARDPVESSEAVNLLRYSVHARENLLLASKTQRTI
ncbi:uncharacterized protein LOC135340701 [Halichondria panicea]|uniref:uncharacterized protein LOC135340701 n=1 Tax=Halichondria panicea TaxID=6063 RepID=UPI00312B4FB2